MPRTTLESLGRYDSVYISCGDGEALLSCLGRIEEEKAEGQSLLLVRVFGQTPAEATARVGLDLLLLGLPGLEEREPGVTLESALSGRRGADQEWERRIVSILDDIARRARPRRIYAPLAVRGHADECLVHDAAIRAFLRESGRDVLLYEERPQALFPGAVRVRLAEMGARLPPGAKDFPRSVPLGLLAGFYSSPRNRLSAKGGLDRLRATALQGRRFLAARAWRPDKAFGPRLQPVLQPAEPHLRTLWTNLAESFPELGTTRTLATLAERYRQALSGGWERYWLLLPERGMDGASPALMADEVQA